MRFQKSEPRLTSTCDMMMLWTCADSCSRTSSDDHHDDDDDDDCLSLSSSSPPPPPPRPATRTQAPTPGHDAPHAPITSAGSARSAEQSLPHDSTAPARPEPLWTGHASGSTVEGRRAEGVCTVQRWQGYLSNRRAYKRGGHVCIHLSVCLSIYINIYINI